MSQNLSVIWVDAGGGSTISLIRSVSGGAAIFSDLLPFSNADWLNQWQGVVAINPTPTPSAGANQSVLTQASLVFLCADRSQVTLALPAPQSFIFLPDGVTVDQSVISGLISTCIGSLVSQSGSHATAYLSGLITNRRNP